MVFHTKNISVRNTCKTQICSLDLHHFKVFRYSAVLLVTKCSYISHQIRVKLRGNALMTSQWSHRWQAQPWPGLSCYLHCRLRGRMSACCHRPSQETMEVAEKWLPPMTGTLSEDYEANTCCFLLRKINFLQQCCHLNTSVCIFYRYCRNVYQDDSHIVSSWAILYIDVLKGTVG